MTAISSNRKPALIDGFPSPGNKLKGFSKDYIRNVRRRTVNLELDLN